MEGLGAGQRRDQISGGGGVTRREEEAAPSGADQGTADAEARTRGKEPDGVGSGDEMGEGGGFAGECPQTWRRVPVESVISGLRLVLTREG